MNKKNEIAIFIPPEGRKENLMIRVSLAEKERIMQLASEYAGGNVSKYVRHMSLMGAV